MTPLEPGWHGHLTIEISNANPCPALIYPNEGIAQLEFELIDGIPELTYDKKGEGGGKYQGQKGVTPSKVL
jgi:dCTP deaminase